MSPKADLVPLLTIQHFDEAMSQATQEQANEASQLTDFLLVQTIARTVAKLEGKLADLGALITTQMPRRANPRKRRRLDSAEKDSTVDSSHTNTEENDDDEAPPPPPEKEGMYEPFCSYCTSHDRQPISLFPRFPLQLDSSHCLPFAHSMLFLFNNLTSALLTTIQDEP